MEEEVPAGHKLPKTLRSKQRLWFNSRTLQKQFIKYIGLKICVTEFGGSTPKKQDSFLVIIIYNRA